MKKEIIAFRKKVAHYKNMLDGFKGFTLNYSRLVNDETLEISADVQYRETIQWVAVEPNTVYMFYFEKPSSCYWNLWEYDTQNGTRLVANDGSKTRIVTSANTRWLQVKIGNGSVGTFIIKKPMMIKGDYVEPLVYAPYTTGKLKERLKDNGHIAEIRVRFYPGVERTLQVMPYVLHKANRREDLFTYPTGSEGFIAGDDDTFVFPVQIDFEYDDELIVEFENVGNYIYTLSCDIVVVYHNEEVLS